MEKNKKRKLFFIYLFLVVFLIFALLPYVWLILTSFKTRVDAFAIPPKVLFKATLNNYQ